jgi:HAD superfamily phosphatase (TIGR01668 family)
MKTLEDLVAEKLCDLVHYALSKIIKPDMTLNKVNELDIQAIEKMKQQYGIEAIILDVDDTLRKEMKDIPKCNKEWIEGLKGKIKIMIVSNGVDRDIEKYFKENGIDYIGFACKPLKKNFLKACEKMNVKPESVLMVGDSLFDDIYGGKRNNMKTALVKEVEDNER